MAALYHCVVSLLRLLHFQFIPEASDRFALHPFGALTATGC
jgi:hypothetical protein